MPDIVRQPGARLSGQVDPRLAKRFYPGPLANLRRSYGAFHAFDKTHTVALAEAGLIPANAARAILAGLREMEAQGIEAVRDRMGGGRHSGEAFLTEKLGANVAGWINLGRSSGDLDAVAWRYNLRQRLPAVLAEIDRLRASLLDVASRHTLTLLPAYSIGQQAQTTTLAHTLLSWEAPFARDAARALAIYDGGRRQPGGLGDHDGLDVPDLAQAHRGAARLRLGAGQHARRRRQSRHAAPRARRDRGRDLERGQRRERPLPVEHERVPLRRPRRRVLQHEQHHAAEEERVGAGVDPRPGLARARPARRRVRARQDGVRRARRHAARAVAALRGARRAGGHGRAARRHGRDDDASTRRASPRGRDAAGRRRPTSRRCSRARPGSRGAMRIRFSPVSCAKRSMPARARRTSRPPTSTASRAAVLGRALGVTPEAIRSAVDPRQSIENRRVVDGSPAPADVEAQIRAARAALATDAARIDALVARQRDAAARLEAAVDAVLAGSGDKDPR